MAAKKTTKKRATKRRTLKEPEPELRVRRVPLVSLVPDPKNARAHSARNIDTIKASLLRFGQQKPIVVREKDMRILAGNGTYEAAKKLNWAYIDVVYSSLDGNEATAFGIADNRSAELAEWDWNELAFSLQTLRDAEDLNLLAIGWEPEEVDAVLANYDWTGLPGQDEPEPIPDRKKTIVLLVLDEAKVIPFRKALHQLLVEHVEAVALKE